jgi:hypothetical protein
MKRLQTQNFHESNPPQAFALPDSLPRIHKWRAGSDFGTRALHLTSKSKKESRKMTNEMRRIGVPLWSKFPILERQIIGNSSNPLIFQ